MKTESVFCLHCDHEHECEVVSEEFEDWTDIPDSCENCGEPLVSDIPVESKEDFHSDC